MKAAKRVSSVEIGRRLTTTTSTARSVHLHLSTLSLLVHVIAAVVVMGLLLLLLLRMMMLSGRMWWHVVDHLRLVGMGRRAYRLIGSVCSASRSGRARLTTDARAAATAAAGARLWFDEFGEDLFHLVLLVVGLPDVVEIENVLGDLEYLTKEFSN